MYGYWTSGHSLVRKQFEMLLQRRQNFMCGGTRTIVTQDLSDTVNVKENETSVLRKDDFNCMWL